MPVLRRVGSQLLGVVVTFGVLGVVAGLVWWRLADPPYYVRTAQGAVMDQAQLARRVHADGTFLVLGLVASLVAAAVLWRLSRRRDDDALLALLLGTVAAAAAGLLALWLGRTLGHVDVRSAVQAAKVGSHVTDTLTVISPAVVLVWPIGYLLLTVGLLWGTSDKPVASEEDSDTMVASTHPGDPMTETATYPVPESAEPPRPSGRRTTLIAGVTAATLVVVGGGAFAAVHFLSSGDDAEQALPASSVAVASINLDPGAAQKVEALKTLRKFPGLRKQLGISSTGDLRRAFFDEAVKDGHCKGVSYDTDVEPWIGDSAAVAAVPFSSGKVTPVVALAVTDQKKAAAAFTKLDACSSKKSDQAAWAFGDGFALLSDTQAHADAAVKQAASKSLAEDSDYQDWTGRAGDRGVVNFYVAKRAADYLADKAGSLVPPTQFPSDLPSSDLSGNDAGGSGASAPFRRGDDNSDKLKKALKNFQGAAGALRFADGGMELEVVSGGLPGQSASDAGGALVSSLPKDTAAAVGVAVPSDFASKLVSNLKSLDLPFLGDGGSVVDLLQSQLGLSLPGDLQSVLGQGIALSVGGKAPSDLSQLSGLDSVAAGLTVKGGDASKIKQVVSKLEEQAGGSTGALQLHVEDGDGKVALSFDPDYADSLKAAGSLGEVKRFTTVVPHAKDAQFVAYADFDSDWATTLGKNGDAKDRANLAPLQALGLSAWRDGSTSHLLLKVTTD